MIKKKNIIKMRGPLRYRVYFLLRYKDNKASDIALFICDYVTGRIDR